MNDSLKVIIAISIFGIVIAGFGIWGYTVIKNAEEEIEMVVDEKITELQDRENKVLSFVQDFTGFNTEIITMDNGMYVVKADKDLYRVVYDKEIDDIKYMINNDEVVYEMD